MFRRRPSAYPRVAVPAQTWPQTRPRSQAIQPHCRGQIDGIESCRTGWQGQPVNQLGLHLLPGRPNRCEPPVASMFIPCMQVQAADAGGRHVWQGQPARAQLVADTDTLGIGAEPGQHPGRMPAQRPDSGAHFPFRLCRQPIEVGGRLATAFFLHTPPAYIVSGHIPVPRAISARTSLGRSLVPRRPANAATLAAERRKNCRRSTPAPSLIPFPLSQLRTVSSSFSYRRGRQLVPVLLRRLKRRTRRDPGRAARHLTAGSPICPYAVGSPTPGVPRRLLLSLYECPLQ